MCLVYFRFFCLKSCFKIDLNRLQGWNSYTINREYNRPFRSYSVAFLWKIPHLEGRNKRLACLRVKRERRINKVLKSQLRAPYCFTRVTHQEIRWRTNTGNCGLQGEKGVSGWTWAWLCSSQGSGETHEIKSFLHKHTWHPCLPWCQWCWWKHQYEILLQWPTVGLRNSHSSENQGLIHIYAENLNEMQKRALCLWELSSQWMYLSLDHNLYKASGKVLSPIFSKEMGYENNTKWQKRVTTVIDFSSNRFTADHPVVSLCEFNPN